MFEIHPWLLVVAGGPVILGLVVAYALVTRRRKSGAEREASERATRRIYNDPE